MSSMTHLLMLCIHSIFAARLRRRPAWWKFMGRFHLTLIPTLGLGSGATEITSLFARQA